MTLEKYRQDKGLTFQSIADALGKKKEAVFKIIKKPWRTSVKTFIFIAKYIGMPKHEAALEWMNAKLKFKADQIRKQAAAV